MSCPYVVGLETIYKSYKAWMNSHLIHTHASICLSETLTFTILYSHLPYKLRWGHYMPPALPHAQTCKHMLKCGQRDFHHTLYVSAPTTWPTHMLKVTWPTHISEGTWTTLISEATWPTHMLEATWPHISEATWPIHMSEATCPTHISDVIQRDYQYM